MVSYHQQLQELFARYEREVAAGPADLRVVGAWALANRLWEPKVSDIHSRFANDMAEALREEYRVDRKGRRYRAKLAVRTSKDGRQGTLWGDIDTSPRTHVEKGLGQKRRQIVGDCLQLRVDGDHYNDAHPEEEPIQLILDFTDDVAEALIAAGIVDDAV